MNINDTEEIMRTSPAQDGLTQGLNKVARRHDSIRRRSLSSHSYISFVVRLSVVSLSFLAITGCQEELYQAKEFARQSDAGSTQVAVISVARWEDRRGALETDFRKLTDDAALSNSIADTQILQQQFLEAYQMTLQAQIKGPGSPATSPFAYAGDSNAAVLPGVTNFASQVSTPETMLHYYAAKALKEELALLDYEIDDVMKPKDWNAYIVRLQITTMPIARNEPYDAYADIGFFTGPSKSSSQTITDGIQVIPLLVTDDLEGELHSRAIENIRQLTASLSAVLHGVTLNGGAQNFDQQRQAAEGTDFNSLLTVGRLSDTTLRVRLGAMLQPDSHYAMVPRTHYITVLLESKNPANPATDAALAHLSSKIYFVDSTTGKTLRGRTRDEMIHILHQKIEPYVGDFTLTSDMDDTFDKMILDSHTHDYANFQTNLMQLCSQMKTKHVLDNKIHYIKDYPEIAWLELCELNVSDVYSSADIFAPLVENKIANQEDTPVFDDGKTMTVMISKTSLSAADLETATAVFKNTQTGKQPMLLPAQSITNVGSALKIVFPSPQLLNTNYFAGGTTHLDLPSVIVSYSGTNSSLSNLTYTALKAEDPVAKQEDAPFDLLDDGSTSEVYAKISGGSTNNLFGVLQVPSANLASMTTNTFYSSSIVPKGGSIVQCVFPSPKGFQGFTPGDVKTWSLELDDSTGKSVFKAHPKQILQKLVALNPSAGTPATSPH